MRTAEIEIRDMNGGCVFGGYQLDHGPEWHVSGIHYAGVLIASNRGDLAKLISREVHQLSMWSVHTHWNIKGEIHDRHVVNDCYPDEMGGVVIDGEYLGYAEMLRRIIPKTVDSEEDTR